MPFRWPSLIAASVLALATLGAVALFVPPAAATPAIALRESQNCQGCHNPGRSQRPVLERRCTLDCQGCHIDPAGAGPRNQWGYYYSQDQSAMVNLFKPQDPMRDESRFDVHYDGRMLNQKVEGDPRWRSFPMSNEFAIRVRPFVRYLHLTYQNLLLGRIGDHMFRIGEEGDRRFRERWSVMVDQLPMNLYVRAYRGQPMYGLRRPNHTAWIRQRIGLDPFATTEAAEFGGTPNVPFFRVSRMRGDPYAPKSQRQAGTSWHGGLRGVSFGWHVNGSGWDTKSEDHAIRMQALGGGANAFGLIAYAERNWRTVSALGAAAEGAGEGQGTFLYPSSEISEYSLIYGGIRGLAFGTYYETLDDARLRARRQSLYLEVKPVPFLGFELWDRREWGTRHLRDVVAVAHAYADF